MDLSTHLKTNRRSVEGESDFRAGQEFGPGPRDERQQGPAAAARVRKGTSGIKGSVASLVLPSYAAAGE